MRPTSGTDTWVDMNDASNPLGSRRLLKRSFFRWLADEILARNEYMCLGRCSDSSKRTCLGQTAALQGLLGVTLSRSAQCTDMNPPFPMTESKTFFAAVVAWELGMLILSRDVR